MHLSIVRGCRIAAFALSAAVAAAAVLVLAGWAMGSTVLTTAGTGTVPMNPLTAVCFLLLGTALLVALPPGEHGAEAVIARTLPVIVLILAAIKLAMPGRLDGPDAWLFRNAVNASAPVSRMAPNTALLMVPIALAILLIDVHAGRWRPAQFLVAAALPLSLTILVGYLFGVSEFYGWGAYVPTARVTAVSFAALEFAILAGRVEHGLTRIFAAEGAGGVIARRLVPAAMAAPLVIGYLRLVGQRRGFYGSEFGVVLFTLTMVAVFSALVWWTAWSVHRVDAARAEMDVRLQTLIRNVPLGIVVLDLDGRVQLCNDAFVELFHYPAQELRGRRVDELIAPQGDGGETASLTQRGFAGETIRRTTVRRRRDGALVDVELFVVPLTMKGRAIGTYGVYRDVSDRRAPRRPEMG